MTYDEASFKYKVKQEGLDVSIYERAFRLDSETMLRVSATS